MQCSVALASRDDQRRKELLANSAATKWDDLRVFLEVARQGSVHAAARRLKLDHSTVCRRIDRLESKLSLKLLDRTRKGIVVREEAQNLLKHIEEMDRRANLVDDVISRDAASAVQVVRIATMEGIASRYLARRLLVLDQIAPGVKIELLSIPQTVDLSRKEADIFLSFFNPKAQGLKSTALGEFALFLYAAKAYAQKYGMPKNSADLANHTFVGYIDELLAIHAVRWLDEVITAPKICFHSNSIIAQCSAAVSGLGIVLLPTFVAAGVTELNRILPDQISVRRDVWMSVRTEQNHLVKIKLVSKFLKHIFESDVDFLLGKTDQFPC